MYKKLKVVMLATQDTTAPIGIDDNSGKLFKFEPNEALWGYQHLYLLSDDEIKENDWFYADEFTKPEQAKYFEGSLLNGFIKSEYRKIVASTDESLNVARILNDFIEKYVNAYNANKPIESIDIEYDVKTVQVYPKSGRDAGGFEKYETQEVLKTDKNNRVIIKTEKETWTIENLRKLAVYFKAIGGNEKDNCWLSHHNDMFNDWILENS